MVFVLVFQKPKFSVWFRFYPKTEPNRTEHTPKLNLCLIKISFKVIYLNVPLYVGVQESAIAYDICSRIDKEHKGVVDDEEKL